MYHAKRTGKSVQLYVSDIDANSPRRLELMSGLRRAIGEQQLILHYQPKIFINGKPLPPWKHWYAGSIPIWVCCQRINLFPSAN